MVKLGTGVLTDEKKQPDQAQLLQLVRQLVALRNRGLEVVIVTSGAVGSGMGVLGFAGRPKQLAELQACAAVGQTRLMAQYEKLFSEHQLHVAQVLLTHDDLQNHTRHLNGRNTLLALLKHGIIPIINENDAISTTELKFGDNDKLSALVASLLPADLLIILTTVDGLIEGFGTEAACLRTLVESIDANLEGHASGTSSATAIGGMKSKLQAAKISCRSGIPLVIANGRNRQVLREIMEGEEVGTFFVPDARKLTGKKRWIAFFHHARGILHVDDGASNALQELGRSLLSPGISKVEGDFKAGDVVSIRDSQGTEIARGIADCGAADFPRRAGSRIEVIHRDHLVLL